MLVRDVQEILEAWAPREIAWERDNVGLQIGSPEKRVRRILVTLDVTDAAILEARKKRIDLLISHHPLIFHPLTTIDTRRRVDRLVTELIRHDLALYAAHTNLDFTARGVSFALGEKLQLHNMSVLHKDLRLLKKIVVFVPSDHIEAVSRAMTSAGGGALGNYEECTFRTEGVGTFTPLKGSKPAIGKKGIREHVREVRLEMIVPSWKIPAVVAAMRSAHPYEEIAYDVYSLENISRDMGAGIIGELKTAMSLKGFLQHVRRSLRVPTLRYAGGANKKIRRVAACGGSGSAYITSAIREHADAYVTADISYHTFQESDGIIALIDAGHYETERPVVHTVVSHLQNALRHRRERIEILPSSLSSNAVQYSFSKGPL